MDEGTTKTYSVGELAEVVGVSRRAIRYYVQQGVVPPPIGLGRGAHYTQEHVDALKRLRDLQADGVQLADMRLDADEPASAEPEPEQSFAAAEEYEPVRWFRLEVEDGVEIHVRSDRAPAIPMNVLTGAASLLRAHIPKRR